MGFTAFVMESGFSEALAVDVWVTGGPGTLDRLLVDGVTYHMGECAECAPSWSGCDATMSKHDRPSGSTGWTYPTAAHRLARP
jgi:erythromycin esterase-like protein